MEGTQAGAFMKNCGLWEGCILEKLVEDSLLWEGSYDGVGDECGEEGVTETLCDELTTTPIPCPPLMLRGRR